MKILFVSGGNKNQGPSAPVKSQAKSLINAGVDLDQYSIKGKGVSGYLRNIPEIKKRIKRGRYDLIHAHYSFSGFAVALARPKIPLVVSLMGTDTKRTAFWRLIIKMFSIIYWDVVIVKSDDMRKLAKLRKARVIPNGVDMDVFREMDKKAAFEKTGFDPEKKHIIFVAKPSRYEKNLPLARNAYQKLKRNDTEFHVVWDVGHENIPYYMNAADVLLLTSHWEGSPNVVKEAMACNLPVVSVDVGDVKHLLKDVKGCYISSYREEDVAEKLDAAITYSSENGRTNGAERVKELQLDDNSVAASLLRLYKKYTGEKINNANL